MKESKATVKREVSALKKGGASKALVAHELAEPKVEKFSGGGKVRGGGAAVKGIGKGQVF